MKQKEAKGLGHAIWTARHAVGQEPFAVLLGDDLIVGEPPCTKQLIQVAQTHYKSVIGVMKVPESEVFKYGIIDGVEKQGILHVQHVVEKPRVEDAPSCFAIPGRYVLSSDIFEILAHTKPGVGGEIQLTDGLEQLAQAGMLLATPILGKRYDTGDRLGYLEATLDFALERKDLKEAFKKMVKEKLL